MANNGFPLELEPFLATIARLLANEGAAREVAILANAQAQAVQVDYDNWDGGIYIYALHLQIPVLLYGQLSDNECETCEQKILDQAQIILRPYRNNDINYINITPLVSADENGEKKHEIGLLAKKFRTKDVYDPIMLHHELLTAYCSDRTKKFFFIRH